MRASKLIIVAYVILFNLAVLDQINAAEKEFERELQRLRTVKSDFRPERNIDRNRDVNNNDRSEPNRNSVNRGRNTNFVNRDRR